MLNRTSALFYKRAASPLMALIPRIRAHLRQGGVIAYATESCFGLGCDPRNFQAVRRILDIKGRTQSKGLILVASDFNLLIPYLAPLSPDELIKLDQMWPGPTTALIATKPSTPNWLTGKHNTIAARVTAHTDTARLSHALNMALVSTSANRSGNIPYKQFQQCVKAFGDKVMVLPGRIGKRKRPSTILDLKSGKILRN